MQPPFGRLYWCVDVRFWPSYCSAFIWSNARSHFSSCVTHFLFEKCFSELRDARAIKAWRITSDLSEIQLNLWRQIFQTCQTLGGAKPLSPRCLKCHSDRTKWESGRFSWSGVLTEMKYGAEILCRKYRGWTSGVWAPVCSSMSFYWTHGAEMSRRNTAAGKRCSQKERQDKQALCDLCVTFRSRPSVESRGWGIPHFWCDLKCRVWPGSILPLELIVPHHSNRSLCSESAGLPVVPRVSERWMGGRAFSYQSPFLWNQLPVWVQGAGTHSVFKVRLKTLLLDRQKQKEPAQSTLLSWPQSTVLL